MKFGFWADAEPHIDDSSTSEGDGGSRAGTADKRQRAVAVHSLSSTACYVLMYYRYLKKFPNLNFRRDNPRLQVPGEGKHNKKISAGDGLSGAMSPPPSAAATGPAETPAKATTSEIVGNSNRFQFSIKEGIVVVKEALDALLAVKCIDRIVVSETLTKLSELERRVRLLALPGEETECRYQLHFLCVSLIHTILSRAPRLLLLKNQRKLFVEINSCMLALLGVVLNCSLVFWQPSTSRWSTDGNGVGGSSGGGSVAPERVEFICAHLIELVVTQGEIDHRRPSAAVRAVRASGRRKAVPAAAQQPQD